MLIEAGRYKEIPVEQRLWVSVILVLLRKKLILYFTAKYAVA